VVPALTPIIGVNVGMAPPPCPSVRRICEHVFVRWDNLTISSESARTLPGYREPAQIRTFDAPEALDVRFYEIRAKSIVNRVPKASQVPFRWTINPYRGCTHACMYCFARPTHKYLDFDARRDFEREIVVKVNTPEVARAELMRPSWKHEHVALGTNTDPYQWVEKKYELLPGVWEAMRDSGTPCSVLTKSPLLLRDVELFKQIPSFAANLSVPTLDEKAWRTSEPHTPHPRKRIEAVAELNRAGIPTGVLIAPLMPGINDEPRQVEEILELCARAGATSIGGICLHLRGEVRSIVMDWLRSYRPDLVPRYQRLYARGAYAPTAERARLARLVRSGRRLSPDSGGGARDPSLLEPDPPGFGLRDRSGDSEDDESRRAPATQPSLF
jgi:DNA repair photolyase